MDINNLKIFSEDNFRSPREIELEKMLLNKNFPIWNTVIL